MRVKKELDGREIAGIIEQHIYSTTQAKPDSVYVDVHENWGHCIVADVEYEEPEKLPTAPADPSPDDDRFPVDGKDRAMTGQSFDNGVRAIEVTGCANCPLLGEVPGGRLCWPTGEYVDGTYKTCGQDGERVMRIPSLAADFRLSLCPLERRDLTLRLAPERDRSDSKEPK